ncbi:HTTM domain-containing protein [Arthrobacter echini]|nr:HTTM domain-containing protein [Arthrobacter echini]
MRTDSVQRLSAPMLQPLNWVLEGYHAVAAVGFIRAVYGLTTLGLMLTSWPDRHLFFGPRGLLSSTELKDQWTNEDAWSVLNLASTPLVFDVFYLVFMAVALLTMLGLGGRPVLLLHYTGTWSLFSQNSLLGDGGDNLMYICGIFLLLTRCFDRFTVLPAKNSRRTSVLSRWIPGWASILAHNTGVLLIAVQICIVYFIAGSFKMQGEMWTSGTALYYVLRNPEYHLPGMELLFYFAFPSVIATYITVISQVFFPVLVLFQRTRVAAVILMMVFHLGIAVMMGLTSFGLIMLACDTIFVSHHLATLIDKITGRSHARTATDPHTSPSPEVTANAHPLKTTITPTPEPITNRIAASQESVGTSVHESTDQPLGGPTEPKAFPPVGDNRKAPA